MLLLLFFVLCFVSGDKGGLAESDCFAASLFYFPAVLRPLSKPSKLGNASQPFLEFGKFLHLHTIPFFVYFFALINWLS
jgi:hypothetical protein